MAEKVTQIIPDTFEALCYATGNSGAALLSADVLGPDLIQLHMRTQGSEDIVVEIAIEDRAFVFRLVQKI